MRGLLVLVLLAVSSVAFADKADSRAIVIILDRSGSMQGPRLEAAKDGAVAALGKLVATDKVAVIAFDSVADVIVKPQAPGKAVGDQVAKIKAGGGTNFLPALEQAHALLA